MKVVGFCGFSGSGKTTLVEQLISRLRLAGQRVSVIKHAHHDFDIDQPGKDSHRHREAGAFEVVIASDRRLALVREFEQPAQLTERVTVPRALRRGDARNALAVAEATVRRLPSDPAAHNLADRFKAQLECVLAGRQPAPPTCDKSLVANSRRSTPSVVTESSATKGRVAVDSQFIGIATRRAMVSG